MNRFLITLSLCTFLLPLQAEELNLSPLKEALTKRDLYGSVITEVIQHKTLPSLTEPLITKGNLWILPQKAFRWEQGDPLTHIAIYNEKSVYLLNEKEKTIEKHKDSSREVRPLMLLLGMGKDSTYEGLLDNFKAQEAQETAETFTVIFTPDSGLMKRAVSTLTLTLNLSTSFPQEIIWEQTDGAVITTTFKTPQFNKAVTEDLFIIPEGEYTEND